MNKKGTLATKNLFISYKFFNFIQILKRGSNENTFYRFTAAASAATL